MSLFMKFASRLASRRGLRAGLSALAVCAAASAQAPAAGQTGDAPAEVAALILEVARRERAMLPRRLEYTWTARVTDRELNKRGAVTKQKVSVYEVYPLRGEFARKLVSEDGVPVSKERAEKELKRAAERMEKAAEEERKRAEGKAPPPPTPTAADLQNPAGIPSFGFATGQRHGSGFGSSEISLAVWRFFRYAEFTRPRRESLRGRETIVLDFRPRADFRPANEVQKPYARLAGRLWLDAADKAVVRLEAWPADARPADLQSPASAAAPEPLVVFEHERMPDGVWLERHIRVRTYGHKELFNGIELDLAKEASDFRRFDAGAGEERPDPPKKEDPPQP